MVPLRCVTALGRADPTMGVIPPSWLMPSGEPAPMAESRLAAERGRESGVTHLLLRPTFTSGRDGSFLSTPPARPASPLAEKTASPIWGILAAVPSAEGSTEEGAGTPAPAREGAGVVMPAATLRRVRGAVWSGAAWRLTAVRVRPLAAPAVVGATVLTDCSMAAIRSSMFF